MLTLHMRDVLFHQISDEMKTRIGIRIREVPPEPDARLAYDLNTVACVRRRFRNMIKQVDPSVLKKNLRLPWPELEAMSRDLLTDDIEQLQVALDWVCNQMLESAWRQVPLRVRQQYNGSACIDATPLPVGIRLGNDTICPSDPDGGVYNRDGDHSDVSDSDSPGRGKFDRVTDVRFFAYDVHLIVATDDRPGVKQHLPSLPLAMTLTRPGEDPAGSARRMFASADDRGHVTGWLSGDALYTNQNKDQYQVPALEMGRKVVMTYTDDQLGNKQGSHASGARMIEGWYYCPSMPDTLVNATLDLRKGRINRETWRKRIEQRRDYRMRRAEKADDNGFERFRCPAAGSSPIAVCPFKAKSLGERATRQPDGTKADVRIEIDPSNVPTENGIPPQVCRQDKVSIHIAEGAKFRQTLQYGTDEHYVMYNLMRQSQEGEHGRVKDQAYEALDLPGKRRMRGRAVQSIFAAFLLAASAVRKTRTFLAKAEEPADDDAVIYVLKRDPKKRPNTWNTDLPDTLMPPELEPEPEPLAV